MGKKKKLLSLLISVTMVIAMFPALVSADEEPGTFTDLQAEIDAAGESGTVTLLKDYVYDPTVDAATGGIIVAGDVYPTLDLNGHTIDRNLGGESDTAQDDGYVICLSNGAWIEITDSSYPSTGCITGGYALNGGGIYVEEGCGMSLSGGSITGNRASSAGGAIYISGSGYEVTLYGGQIFGNSSGKYGGGIYAGKDSKLKLTYYRTSPELSDNTAPLGGAIYNEGSLTFERGSISGNTATSLGGGIYQAGGELKMQDIPVVENNTGGDVYLPEGEVITLGDNYSYLQPGAHVGISGASDQVVTFGYGAYFGSFDPNNFFFPSDDSMTIALNDAGEVVLQGGQQVEAKAVFMGHTLTLGNELGYNFYVDLSTLDDDMKASSEMVFEIPGRGINTPQTVTYAESSDETVKYEDPDTHETKTGTFRKFTCKLSPVQMGETIKATFYYGDKTEVNESKVEDYLAFFDKLPVDATTVLVKATVDYGYYLQQYLSKLEKWSIVDRTTDDSNDGYAAITKHYDEYNSSTFTSVAGNLLTNGYKAQLTPGAASIKKVSYTLDTRSTTTLEVFFEVEQGTVFTVDQEGFDVRLVKDTKDGQTRYRYRVRIENLLAQQLGTKFTISGTADGDSFEVSVSPLSYVLTVLNSNNYTAARQNAAAALFFYYTQANSYSGN